MWINKRVEEPGGGDCLLVHGLFDQQGTQYQWCDNGSHYHYQHHSGEYILRDDIATEFTALIDHNHGDLGARDHAETQQNSVGPFYDSQCWGSNTKKLSQGGGNKQYGSQTERWNNGARVDLHADMDKKERRQEFIEVGKPGISMYRLRISAKGQTREQRADGEGKTEVSCHRGNRKTSTQHPAR